MFRVFLKCGWLVSDRPSFDPAKRPSSFASGKAFGRRGPRVLSALVSTGRATGHAHFARLRSNLFRLDTTATRTRQAAASDRHRAKKKNVPPRATVKVDRRPESALPFFRVSSFSCSRFSPPVDRKVALLLGVVCYRSCLGTAAGCRTTTAPATDTATARSSPAEDGATNPRRRTALDAR